MGTGSLSAKPNIPIMTAWPARKNSLRCSSEQDPPGTTGSLAVGSSRHGACCIAPPRPRSAVACCVPRGLPARASVCWTRDQRRPATGTYPEESALLRLSGADVDRAGSPPGRSGHRFRPVWRPWQPEAGVRLRTAGRRCTRAGRRSIRQRPARPRPVRDPCPLFYLLTVCTLRCPMQPRRSDPAATPAPTRSPGPPPPASGSEGLPDGTHPVL